MAESNDFEPPFQTFHTCAVSYLGPDAIIALAQSQNSEIPTVKGRERDGVDDRGGKRAQ